MRQMLNLGCGTRFHPDWTNVDLFTSASGILAHDLRRPLPFPDNSFDVVYHSHVLEHFSRADSLRFLRECYRVCRPGGVIRVVVPDLERIARLYLEYLEQACQGEVYASERYDWMMLELYDQAVRTRTGGEMNVYVRDAPLELTEFLASRIGKSMYLSLQSGRAKPSSKVLALLKLTTRPGRAWYHFRALVTRGIMAVLWGRTGLEIAEEVLFRRQGEVHRWMYDRYSLRRAIERAGFSKVMLCSANESRLEGWKAFGLDSESDGMVYKPDSLFCEAVKPGYP